MFGITFYVLINIYFLAFVRFYISIKDKKYWNSFTRIISTFNALQCIYMVISVLFQNHYEKIDPPLSSIYYKADDFSINSLFIFSGYLAVDGIFQLPDLYYNFSGGMVLSILHHVIGGYGIYLIAETRLGFFLGLYFAMTEISTPLLNLSWFLRTNLSFSIFYLLFYLSRIVTIPFLLFYLNDNEIYINTLSPIYIFMAFYASYALIALNCMWYIFLTLKFCDICKNKKVSKLSNSELLNLSCY